MRVVVKKNCKIISINSIATQCDKIKDMAPDIECAVFGWIHKDRNVATCVVDASPSEISLLANLLTDRAVKLIVGS